MKTLARTDAFGFFSNPTEGINDDDDATSTGGADTPRNSNSVAPVASTLAAGNSAIKRVQNAKDPNKPKRIRRSLAQIEEDERNGIKRKKTYPKKKKVVEP